MIKVSAFDDKAGELYTRIQFRFDPVNGKGRVRNDVRIKELLESLKLDICEIAKSAYEQNDHVLHSHVLEELDRSAKGIGPISALGVTISYLINKGANFLRT